MANISRRSIIASLGVLLVAPVVALVRTSTKRSTPSLTEGPFYPKSFKDDTDPDLLKVGNDASLAAGVPIEIFGRVLDLAGNPIDGTVVELWQCDNEGIYHHDEQLADQADGSFQGFGRDICDERGRFQFRTIKPVPYPGRTPHIHFKVFAPDRGVLTTQLFLAEYATANQQDFLYRRLSREEREMVTATLNVGESQFAAGRIARGEFNIILA